MRNHLLIANWKMNGDMNLIKEFSSFNWSRYNVDIIFALPNTLLFYAKTLHLKLLSAQDVSANEIGAFTGECSASMLKEVGCSYSIIGHSERRLYFKEDEELLIKKWKQLHNQDINVIYCIGESLEDYDNNRVEEVLKSQLYPMIDNHLLTTNTVIAYEPIWAIGTGKAATSEYIEFVHKKIRSIIEQKCGTMSKSLRILYGGSVKPDNASSLISCENVDGFLVGGASLKRDSFKSIIEVM